MKKDKEEICKLVEEKKALQERIRVFETNIEDYKQKMETDNGAKEEQNVLKEKNSKMKGTLTDLKVKIEKEIEDKNNLITEKTKEISHMQEIIVNLKGELEENKREKDVLDTYEVKIRKYTTEIRNLENKLNIEKLERKKIGNEKGEIDRKYKNQENEINKLREKLAMERREKVDILWELDNERVKQLSRVSQMDNLEGVNIFWGNILNKYEEHKTPNKHFQRLGHKVMDKLANQENNLRGKKLGDNQDGGMWFKKKETISDQEEDGFSEVDSLSQDEDSKLDTNYSCLHLIMAVDSSSIYIYIYILYIYSIYEGE